MKKIKVKELRRESFDKYGSFANLINPDACKIGEEPSEFFRDMSKQDLGTSNKVCFSTCRVLKRAEVIDNIEYHEHTGEGMLPLDGDIYLSVAPATANGDVPFDRIEVFRIPQGTIVVINPGVWHCAAYPCKKDCINVLITLPERTYANDCIVVKLSNENYVEIEK
jgi:ureidoglycolate lyase